MKRTVLAVAAFVAAAAALIVAGVVFWYNSQPPVLPTPQYTVRPSATPSPTPSAAPTPAPTLTPDDGGLPQDKLFITEAREGYESGSLSLQIPRLDVDAPVLDGTDEATLLQGLGLYEYAQLPGEGNRNVSIAGHRDIYGAEFYYLDQLQEGDACYLDYGGREYTYIYQRRRALLLSGHPDRRRFSLPDRRDPHLSVSVGKELCGGAQRLEPHLLSRGFHPHPHHLHPHRGGRPPSHHPGPAHPHPGQ